MNSAALKKLKTMDGDLKLATFGGGCFWCTEAMFRELNGVESVLSGYSGGQIKKPTYKEVSSGLSSHAEVIQLVYDESKISFEDLVKVHLHTHNPTTLNRQGADFGTQYRSIIFFRTEDEEKIIKRVIEEEQKEFDSIIKSEIEKFDFFVEAEDYHQDYYSNNKESNNYCSLVISPKLTKLRAKYSDKLKVNANKITA
jgi:peptide methionine sulfoxide reductase msrA/msrB